MRPEKPSSIYLDSNCLVYVITNRPGSEDLAEILQRAERGVLTVVISTFSYVEVRGWGKSDPYPPELDRRAIDILDHPNIMRVEFSRRVALRARKLAHSYPLSNGDAIHLSSAIEAQADVFMTEDSDFRRGEYVERVWIDSPYVPGDQPIPGI